MMVGLAGTTGGVNGKILTEEIPGTFLKTFPQPSLAVKYWDTEIVVFLLRASSIEAH